MSRNITSYFTFSKKLALLLVFLVLQASHSQTKETSKEKDSLRMYKNLENYSRKRGFTRFLHRLIFRPITKKKEVKKNSFQKTRVYNFRNTEGKIIRKINIVTLDPFGFSESDTTKKPDRWAYRFGNRVHNKTSRLAIRNLLLIRRNKPLDSLLIKESERLIRSQRYVRAVVIKAVPVSQDSDSVDVNIRVLDSWSLIPDLAVSGSKGKFVLNERNFLGTGHQFRNVYQNRFGTGDNAYSTLYNIPNILNTYINTTVSYDIDLDRNYVKALNIERPFFSPFARWAAGAYFEARLLREILVDSNSVEYYKEFRWNTQDYWAGHAFPIFKGTSEKSRTTNFITSFRYLHTDYIRKPDTDIINFFSDSNLYLLGIGISSQQFTPDKYLYNYQVVEDVPSGIVYGLTGGYQTKNDDFRFYAGGRFAYGRYFKYGHFGTDIQYGSFYSHGASQQSAFTFQLLYFTNLLETTRWKFRQFVKPELVIGNSRLSTDSDLLSLNNNNGIEGFNGSTVLGTKKLFVTLQTQSYSPWTWIGFRFNPYFNTTVGMVGSGNAKLGSSRLYSQFGLGVIISNDYLVFSSFQLSFAFYPTIPGVGDNLFKTNAYDSRDLGFQQFDFSKPQLVPYQ